MKTFEVRTKLGNELCTVFADGGKPMTDQAVAEAALEHMLDNGVFGGTYVCNKTEYGKDCGGFEFDLAQRSGNTLLQAVVVRSW